MLQRTLSIGAPSAMLISHSINIIKFLYGQRIGNIEIYIGTFCMSKVHLNINIMPHIYTKSTIL